MCPCSSFKLSQNGTKIPRENPFYVLTASGYALQYTLGVRTFLLFLPARLKLEVRTRHVRLLIYIRLYPATFISYHITVDDSHHEACGQFSRDAQPAVVVSNGGT